MKKILYTIAAISACFLVSCQEEEFDLSQKTDNAIDFVLTQEGSETRGIPVTSDNLGSTYPELNTIAFDENGNKAKLATLTYSATAKNYQPNPTLYWPLRKTALDSSSIQMLPIILLVRSLMKK